MTYEAGDRDLELEELRSQIAELQEQNRELQEQLNRAKNPHPYFRPSKSIVQRLANKACLDIVREGRYWFLKLGDRLSFAFRSLKEIWLWLTKESWALSDLFPEENEEKEEVLPPQKNRRFKPRYRPRFPGFFALELSRLQHPIETAATGFSLPFT